MKKSVIYILMLFGITGFYNNKAFSQEWTVSLGFSGVVMDRYFAEDWGYDSFTEMKFESLPLSFRLGFAQHWGNTAVFKLLRGTSSSYSIEPSLILRPTMGRAFQPFAGIGFGVFSNSVSSLSIIDNQILQLYKERRSQTIDRKVGVVFSGGINVIATPRISVMINVKYSFYEPNINTLVTNVETNAQRTLVQSAQFDPFSFGFGFRIHLMKGPERKTAGLTFR